MNVYKRAAPHTWEEGDKGETGLKRRKKTEFNHEFGTRVFGDIPPADRKHTYAVKCPRES